MLMQKSYEHAHAYIHETDMTSLQLDTATVRGTSYAPARLPGKCRLAVPPLAWLVMVTFDRFNRSSAAGTLPLRVFATPGALLIQFSTQLPPRPAAYFSVGGFLGVW